MLNAEVIQYMNAVRFPYGNTNMRKPLLVVDHPHERTLLDSDVTEIARDGISRMRMLQVS